MTFSSITETIGNTPLVELKRINPNYPRVRLYAKLEGFNPTGSLKDRIAKYMVEKAELKGELTKDKILIEATSGNTGISLAMFARLKGYKFIAVMPENVSRERIELIKGFGAEVMLTAGDKGTNGAIQVAREIVNKNSNYLMLDQFSNPNNVLAHYETTAEEIIRELPQVDMFIAGLGTGGTLMGVGKRLKEINPGVKIIAVQPYPQIGGIAGLRNIWDGFIPSILDIDQLDASEFVTPVDSFKRVRELIHKEGIFAGISSGAVIHIAIKYASELTSGTIVSLLADGGWKYMSEKILTEKPDELARHFPGPLW